MLLAAALAVLELGCRDSVGSAAAGEAMPGAEGEGCGLASIVTSAGSWCMLTALSAAV